MPYYKDGKELPLLDALPHLKDATVPTWFCDFDGVINAMPYERVWVGAEGRISEFDMYDPTNWKVVTHQPDESKHFGWDNVVEAETGGRTFTLRFSSELVDNIRALITSGAINFVWLTSWNEDSMRVLNPLLGLPEDTPYLPWYQHRSDYEHMGKFSALKELLKEIAPSARKPFIWTDDVITKHFAPTDFEGRKNYVEYNFSQRLKVDSLIIQTNPLFGIDRREWALIEDFLGIRGSEKA